MQQPDPVLLANTKEWLARAREDLETAAYTLTAPAPFVRSALFHCQQAVEKGIRATHNLIELGEACAEIDPNLTSEVRQVAVLTKYAARFRYPGAPYEPSLEEARESLALAREFLGSVLATLPPEVT